MKLSIVSTLYHSAPYLKAFTERVSATAKKCVGDDYESILVNDGSPGRSLETAVALHEQNSKITVIDLARNFGRHRAIMTGLSHAIGDHVVLVDCDLEEEPELLETFFNRIKGSDLEAVYGVMLQREGEFFRKNLRAFFLFGARLPGGNEIPAKPAHGAPHEHALRPQPGLSPRKRTLLRRPLPYHRLQARKVPVKKHSKDTTTYHLRRKLSTAINSIASFSEKPPSYIFITGFFISAISGVAIVYLLSMWFLYLIKVQGWTSLLVSIWFLGGLSIFFIGINGIYVSKIFIEVKERPYSIIRTTYRRKVEEL
jgi:putative glycosyltransferase